MLLCIALYISVALGYATVRLSHKRPACPSVSPDSPSVTRW